MILDSLKDIFAARQTDLCKNPMGDDYDRAAALSVIVYAYERFNLLIEPVITASYKQAPKNPKVTYDLSTIFMRQLIGEIHDAHVQDQILTESIAAIATYPGLYRGGEIDITPLQDAIRKEVESLRRLVEQSIKVHGMEFSPNPDVPKPKM